MSALVADERAREALIVALDVPDARTARVLCERLGGRARRVKIGMTLFCGGGPAIVAEVRRRGLEVFLDLKLHDIPHQVRGAAEVVSALGIDMLTVHASGGAAMIEAAREGTERGAALTGTGRPRLLAVTVLTSIDATALASLGVARQPDEQVVALARSALAAGADGVVCSPLEARAVRDAVGLAALVVTPGVRPTWAAADDQARVAGPCEAIAAGASHVVVGRPVTGALDPAEAVERLVAEIGGVEWPEG
jgi:orotidine-5'-phosphate decarboxylase